MHGYSDTIPNFLRTAPETIAGRLITKSTFDVVTKQRDAWLVQLKLLRSAVRGLDGSIFLELSIPRIGRRIDAVVIIGAALFAIEFKVVRRFSAELHGSE